MLHRCELAGDKTLDSYLLVSGTCSPLKPCMRLEVKVEGVAKRDSRRSVTSSVSEEKTDG